MSIAGSPSDERKIDIAGSVRAAYTVVIENARLAVDLAWLPFAILIGAEFIALLLGGGGFFGRALAALVQGAGFLVFGSIFIVRWHRFMLLNETTSTALFPPGWGSFVVAAVKIGLSMIVGFVVLGLLAAVPPHFLTGPIAVVGGIALAFAAARMSLVFPAAAVERPMSLREAWDLLAGNYWRLFACFLLCALPFGIINYILGEIGLGLPSILWLVVQIIALAVSFAGIAVATSLLSEVYRGFADADPEAARRAS